MSVQKCYLYKHYLRNIMLEKASFNQQIINDYEYYVIFNCLTFSLMSITTFPNADYFINNSPQMYKFQLPLPRTEGFFSSFNILPVYIFRELRLIFDNLLFGDADSLNQLKWVVQTKLHYKKKSS